MVTKQELVNGYETEIKYHKSFLPLLILGILLALVGILGMIVFGYGIYRGRINLQKVIDDFNQKLTILN